MAIDNATLSHLRGRIAALEGSALGPALEGKSTGEDHGVIPFGLAAIDDHLPAGGLAGGCVHEITDGSNSGSATAFAAALAGRAQRLHRPPVVWIAPRIDQRESLYGPGLAAFGLDPAALIIVRAPGHGRNGAAQALWAMEEALRTPAIGAVCAEIDAVDLTASRRLQLAAEAGGTFGLLLRSPLQDGANNGDNSAIPPAIPPIASVTRWRVTAAPSGPAWPPPLLGATRWQVELLRARGGRPHHWLLEWQHDPTDETAGGFALAAASGDRSAVPAAEQILPLAHTG
jgi:protein ImuA